MEGEDLCAYRAAFESAWRHLDHSLAALQGERTLYPYAVDTCAREESKLIELVGLRPIPVRDRVRELLGKIGVYSPIKAYVESLLRSAPGALQHPEGTECLRAALSTLLPALGDNFLSVRRHEHTWPRVLWDEQTRPFVISSSIHCEESHVLDGAVPCLCWVGVTLYEAVASWRVTPLQGVHAQPVSDAAVFYALQRSIASGGAAIGAPAREPSASSCGSSAREYGTDVSSHVNNDGELEYLDPPQAGADRRARETIAVTLQGVPLARITVRIPPPGAQASPALAIAPLYRAGSSSSAGSPSDGGTPEVAKEDVFARRPAWGAVLDLSELWRHTAEARLGARVAALEAALGEKEEALVVREVLIEHKEEMLR
ncbi:hypothetical protein BD413DRAFT_668948 [Trametes elegans]|nr:hypothetical protein BD413DRAFT_668948 [Trametes elegans]